MRNFVRFVHVLSPANTAYARSYIATGLTARGAAAASHSGPAPPDQQLEVVVLVL